MYSYAYTVYPGIPTTLNTGSNNQIGMSGFISAEFNSILFVKPAQFLTFDQKFDNIFVFRKVRSLVN